MSNNNLGQLVAPEGWSNEYSDFSGEWSHTDGRKQQGWPAGSKPQGAIALADAIKNNGALTSLNVSNNALCGLNKYGRGTYDASGVTALADAIENHQ